VLGNPAAACFQLTALHALSCFEVGSQMLTSLLLLLSTDKPEPWLFTAYRAFGGLLNLLMWLLLLGVVACLMFMLLWLGGAVAVNAAITKGTT
jgi:hypothetical protein